MVVSFRRRKRKTKNKTKRRSIKYRGGNPPNRLNNLFSNTENLKEFEPQIMSRDPWIVVFDKFLSDDEVAVLLEIINSNGGNNFIDSTVYENGGSKKTSYRTSSTFWCDPICLNESLIIKIRERIQSVTGFPKENYETPQFLRYFPGQEYKVHSDFIADDVKKPCGPRVLTLFLYLNDVEEGGETEFPRLNLTIKPRAGRAVLWPSVMGDSLTDFDIRTEHIAKPVVRGVKYSVNIWIHLNNFTAQPQFVSTQV